MFLLLQGDVHIGMPVAIAAACVTAATTALLAYLGTSIANARSQGELVSEVQNIGRAITQERADRLTAVEKLERTDRDQWKAIGAVENDVIETREKVAKIEGQLDVRKARGASAGS